MNLCMGNPVLTLYYVNVPFIISFFFSTCKSLVFVSPCYSCSMTGKQYLSDLSCVEGNSTETGW